MYTTSRPVIDDFLQQKRIAFVGIPRNPRYFNRKLWAEMKRLGYDVVPVHPEAHEVDGVHAVPHVTDIHPGVDAALLMISAKRPNVWCGTARPREFAVCGCTARWDKGP